MARVDRLVRRKERLTKRLREIDLSTPQHRPLPRCRWIRAQLYRVDLLLEREGWFD